VASAPPRPFAPGRTAPSAHPAAAAPTPSAVEPGVARSSAPVVNPFLSADPAAKGRRLARALISDLITYFPDRRAEGLRDGTLRTLFEEEIKKSYEEYLDQVGREFAESTPHFRDALNDILAGGQPIF
jgi:hypothetical protein